VAELNALTNVYTAELFVNHKPGKLNKLSGNDTTAG